MTVRQTLQYTVTGETVLDSTYDYDGFVAYGSALNRMTINYARNSAVEAQTHDDGKMEGTATHMYCSGEFYENNLELEINYYTPGSRTMYYVTGLKYMPD